MHVHMYMYVCMCSVVRRLSTEAICVHVQHRVVARLCAKLLNDL